MLTHENQPTILVAVWREPLDLPVIKEQILRRAAAWHRLGYTVRVAAALRKDDIERCTGAEEVGVSIRIARARRALSMPIWLRRVMKETPTRDGLPNVIVCRGALATVGALIARLSLQQSWCVIHDARGWVTAESRDGAAERVTRRLAQSAIERIAFRQSDFTAVVSEALLGIALCKGADPQRCVLVSPYVDAPTESSQLKPADLPCPPAQVIYVGNSMMAYQGSAQIGAFLKDLSAMLPDISFGWLDLPFADGPLWINPNLWRISATPEQVQNYLQQADLGLLIRPSDRTNAAATPTKAVQYLTAGCKIITSSYPPSIAQLCEVTGVGVVVDGIDPAAWAGAISWILGSQAVGDTAFQFHESSTRQWGRLLHRAVSTVAHA